MNRIEGMKKLMDYVEEMREEGINVCRPQVREYYLLEMMLISKHYPLVKRLVDNDKIDTKKVAEKRKSDGWSIVNYNHSEEQMCKEVMDEYWLDNTLMALSIQDEPIEFLINILK